MPESVNVATVKLWGKTIGAVAWNPNSNLGTFEYSPSFVNSGLDIAPLLLPAKPGIFSFPELSKETFRGLPGLLSDSLPDRFGNALIDTWLVETNRTAETFTPVERLCYIGSRGMGALEFEPILKKGWKKSVSVEIERLVKLAGDILSDRKDLSLVLADNKEKAIEEILRVGTSAGGARPKAIIAWNPKTNEIRSGQVKAPPDFGYWLLKFDGVKNDALGDPSGFGRIEYAYSQMVKACGIDMSDCRLFKENGRTHFMTRRFDRLADGSKLHAQSLCAIAHYDFNMAGYYSYDQCFSVIQRLNLGQKAVNELFSRMVFNVVGRNQDDHTRNITFLMDRDGQWSLSPAYDMTWNYNPQGVWTNRHQMQVNGKLEGITRSDLIETGKRFGIRFPEKIIDKIIDVISIWPNYASKAGVPEKSILSIGKTHQLLRK